MKVISFNKDYNIIRLKRNKLYEYYIEKIDYGDLRYAFGCKKDIKHINPDYIKEIIEFAEEDVFWG
jgi:hypothetical protein